MFLRSTHKRIAFAVVALALLSASACQRDEVENTVTSNRILLEIEEDRPSTRTSADDVVKIPFDLNGCALSLTYGEQEEKPASADEPTRGTALNDSSNPIRKIGVTALRDNGDIYFRDAEVAISEKKGISSLFWPDEPLSFFAYSSSDDDLTLSPTFTRDGESCEGSFDYALPAAATTSPKKDATAQPDVLFAITPDQSLANSSQVHLTFHHALSAILFRVGTMPAGVTLKSISIAGVYSSGHCEMVDLGEEELQFTWSYAGKTQNSTYTEEFDQEAVSGSGDQMGSASTIFMMLPQTMGDDTVFRLGFTIYGIEHTFEKHFNEIIAAWEPDKMYIFTIGLPDDIDVEIDDQVEGNVKSQVTITNTGVMTGYVRAAIVGYWLDGLGEVAAPWLASEGEFAYAADWSTYWKQGADGFYYYLLPLEHGKETERPLFESYTLFEASTDAHLGQSLEIDLAVQIIPIASKSLWSELDSLE